MHVDAYKISEVIVVVKYRTFENCLFEITVLQKFLIIYLSNMFFNDNFNTKKNYP